MGEREPDGSAWRRTGSGDRERSEGAGAAGGPAPGGAPVPPTPAGALAAKLDHLFRAVAAPDRAGRREYTYREAAEAIRRLTGAAAPPVSPTYLWELRTGRRDNPTARHLAGLAVLFGVPPGYFFDDAGSPELAGESELLLALRDPGVRDLACQAAGLSAAALAALAGMADHARRLEGLLPVPSDAPDGRTGPGAAPPSSPASAAGRVRRPRGRRTGGGVRPRPDGQV